MKITYSVFEVPSMSWEADDRVFSAKFICSNWVNEKDAEEYIQSLLDTKDFKKSNFIIHKVYSNL